MEAVSEENVAYLPFYYDKLDVIVSNYHPLSSATSVKYKELEEENFIAIKSSSSHLPYNYLFSFLKDNNINFRGGTTIADSIDTLVLQVSAGLGVGFLSHQVEQIYGRPQQDNLPYP